MDFLELLNKVARVARPAHHEFIPMSTMDELFEESCFDSLDMIMIGMYMAIIYDIDDAVVRDFVPTTPAAMLEFVQTNKKRECESIEWAMELIK